MPAPLGASWDGHGVNFAVAARGATRVDLCVFDPEDAREIRRVALPARTGDVWHGYLPGARPGLHYGLRASGEWNPDEGARYDAAKLLVDPYARALSGAARFDESLTAPPGGSDTAAFVPRGVVIDTAFDWRDDAPPQTPWRDTVVYECHVKGMTARHPGVPEALRGRYLGLAEPVVVEHLESLGVTAVLLLPVQHSCLDAHLGRRGLVNYWGYGTLGFFAPDSRFASGDGGEQVCEFKQMVRRLHSAGLEVLIDVVFNHTPETGPGGCTWSLRGFDDGIYYRLDPSRPGEYEDFTGCGNSLDGREPRVLALVHDCLRYWVEEMHVDGFRFDLAPVLARDTHGAFDSGARFFEMLAEDPSFSGVKLVAEPWDLAPNGGDCSGAFPAPFSEWNGRFRDSARRFWRGVPGERAELSARLAGSEDLFDWNGRSPQASINFITCHDGFTLADLVSYAHKHNEANLEENRDGRDDEDQWNCGAEGPTDDEEIRAARERAKRNLVATLAFSQGVPMLSHGDELGRTQLGNNNAYCQDSELTWIDWDLDEARRALLAFAQRAFALRADNSAFRRTGFFRGKRLQSGSLDVLWLHAETGELEGDDWGAPDAILGMWIPVEAAAPGSGTDAKLDARTVMLLLNGGNADISFELPLPSPMDDSGAWRLQLSSSEADAPDPKRARVAPGRCHTLSAHSLALFEWYPDASAAERPE